jgi:hypothetical protein
MAGCHVDLDAIVKARLRGASLLFNSSVQLFCSTCQNVVNEPCGIGAKFAHQPIMIRLMDFDLFEAGR